MSAYRSSHSPQPPQLILGFGNITHHAIRAGIAVLADIHAAECLRGLPAVLDNQHGRGSSWTTDRPATAAR
jgi:hypothetical protein